MQRIASYVDPEIEVQFLSVTTLLVFGFGTAWLVAHFMAPHWLWLVPGYCLGSILGLGGIWLAYALPERPVSSAGPARTGGTKTAKSSS